MFDVTKLSMKDMTECGKAFRRFGQESASLDEVAEKIVKFLFENLGTHESEPATYSGKSCALVRFFKTQPYTQLTPALQSVSKEMLREQTPQPGLRCLVLRATAGEKSHWNSVEKSAGHRAIPLSSVSMVEQAPMILNLIRQMGIDVASVISPSSDALFDIDQKTFNVFYVPEALVSPFITAQESFVKAVGRRWDF